MLGGHVFAMYRDASKRGCSKAHHADPMVSGGKKKKKKSGFSKAHHVDPTSTRDRVVLNAKIDRSLIIVPFCSNIKIQERLFTHQNMQKQIMDIE